MKKAGLRDRSKVRINWLSGTVLSLKLVAFLIFILSVPLSVNAATIIVNTTDGELNADGDCSLREAIVAANTDAPVDSCNAGSGADTINLPAGTYTLTVVDNNINGANGLPSITSNITINGAGATIIQRVSNAPSFRIFHIASTGNLTLNETTVTGGFAPFSPNVPNSDDGGGIFNNGGTVTIINSTISDNIANSNGGGIENFGTLTITESTIINNTSDSGGGIANDSTVTITNSTISGNTVDGSATSSGGGIFNSGTLAITGSTIGPDNTASERGGGIINEGNTVTITNSTISGNESSSEEGGGIFNDGGTLTINNSTISENSADVGSGIAGGSDTTIVLRNTIVANNSGDNCFAIITSNGNNLDSDDDCGFTGSGDLSNTDPLLGPLANNGGSTQTYALLDGSPAIDAGNNATCAAADQRGVLRPMDGDGNSVAVCDIGAFELEELVTFGIDLGVDIFTPGSGVVGEELTYILTVTNFDTEDATGVTLTDMLPPSVTFVSATPSQGSCSEAGGIVTCNLGVISGSEMGDTEDSARVDIDVIPTVAGVITNTASVTANEVDFNDDNNTDTEDTDISIAMVDLSVDKSDSSDPVRVGEQFTYMIIVENIEGESEPDDAIDVTLTDTLPPSVTFVSATPSRGSCSEAEGIVTCNLGVISGGELGDSVTVDIIVTPTAAGVITNTVAVTANGTDIDPGNNMDTEVTEVMDISIPMVDLSVTKSDSPDPATVGQNLTYMITVTNIETGGNTDDATDVTLTDTLSPSVTFVSATPSQGSCNEAEGIVTCNLGVLNGGEVGNIAEVNIVVTPTVAGVITNTASVTANETDFSPGNNTDSETTTVIAPPNANLSISKSDSTDPVTVGQNLTYRITVTNSGPASATGVRIRDVLPEGVTFVSATPSRGSCNGTAIVICNINNLPSSTSATVDIVVVPAAAGTITNTVRVRANEPDSNTNNNTATQQTTVAPPGADLSITKSDSPDPATVGEELTYRVTIANNGPADATGVRIRDTLPLGVTFVSATPSRGSCNGTATVICNVNSLANGASFTVDIIVIPTIAGSITNIVSITRVNETDPNSDNDRATQTTIVAAPPDADLSVTKSDSPDPVMVEEELTYAITVANNGPADATGVMLTDTLPSTVEFVSAPGCNESGGVVTCDLGSLSGDDGGESVTVNIAVTPTVEGVITNTAAVTANETDSDPDNNTATENTTVTAPPNANLSVSLSDSPDPVTIGQSLTYSITVTNFGPASATGVRIRDVLPEGVTFVSAAPSRGSCRGTAAVVCDINNLPDDGSVTVDIVVTPTAPGTITNTVRVTANEPDSNTNNNRATEQTTVVAPPDADLSISKSDSPDPVIVGENLTYRITVRNSGPAIATGVRLRDILPPGIIFESAPPGCIEADGIVTCSLGGLAVDGTATVDIVVTPTTVGSITNVASVTANEPDLNNDNNIDTENTIVSPPDEADLSVSKSDFPDPIIVGNDLMYVITVMNGGPSDATGVVLTETLPSSVDFVSASPDVCIPDGDAVICDLGDLTVNSSRVISFIVTTTAVGTITNVAEVMANEPDPNIINNTDPENTTVSPPDEADLSVSISGSPDPVMVGNNLTYAITVTNNGPANATGVTLTDTLPSSVDFVSASPGCSESGGVVTCNLGDLAIGNSAELSIGNNAGVEIVVTPAAAGVITNRVSVTADQADPDQTNNIGVPEETTVVGNDEPIDRRFEGTFDGDTRFIRTEPPPFAADEDVIDPASITLIVESDSSFDGVFNAPWLRDVAIMGGGFRDTLMFSGSFEGACPGMISGTLTLTSLDTIEVDGIGEDCKSPYVFTGTLSRRGVGNRAVSNGGGGSCSIAQGNAPAPALTLFNYLILFIPVLVVLRRRWRITVRVGRGPAGKGKNNLLFLLALSAALWTLSHHMTAPVQAQTIIKACGERDVPAAQVLDALCSELQSMGENLTPGQQDLLNICTELVEQADQSEGPNDEVCDIIERELQQVEIAALYANILRLQANNQFRTIRTRIAELRQGKAALKGFASGGSKKTMLHQSEKTAALEGFTVSLGGQGLSGSQAASILPLAIIGQLLEDEPSPFAKFGIFLNGSFNFGDGDGTGFEPGFDFDIFDITGGVDYRFTDDLVLGLAFSYVRVDVDLDSSRGTLDTSGYNGSIYGSFYPLEQLYIDAIATVGRVDYDLERDIVFTLGDTDIDQTARSDTDGVYYSFGVNAGYNFDIGGFSFGPFGRFNYSSADIDGFQEETDEDRPGFGLALDVESREAESLTTALGGQLSYTLSMPFGILVPQLLFEWVHEYKDDSVVSSASLLEGNDLDNNDNFDINIETDEPDRDTFNLGGGLSAVFPYGISTFVYYEAVLGSDDLSSHYITAGVRKEL